MQKSEETIIDNTDENDILVYRAKIVSFLTALQLRKLTLKQATELERLMVKERARAIRNGIVDLDIILGYYLVGLYGYANGRYYPST